MYITEHKKSFEIEDAYGLYFQNANTLTEAIIDAIEAMSKNGETNLVINLESEPEEININKFEKIANYLKELEEDTSMTYQQKWYRLYGAILGLGG